MSQRLFYSIHVVLMRSLILKATTTNLRHLEVESLTHGFQEPGYFRLDRPSTGQSAAAVVCRMTSLETLRIRSVNKHDTLFIHEAASKYSGFQHYYSKYIDTTNIVFFDFF